MCDKLVLSLVLFSLLVHDITASVNSTACFFLQANTLVGEFGGLTNQNCTIVNTNSTVGADDSRFNNVDACDVPSTRGFQSGNEKEKFELSTGLGINNSGKEIIVLNVTISHVTFHKLSIRHQDLAEKKKKEVYSQTIEFLKDQIPETVFLFSSVFESYRSNLQFFAEGKDYSFSKEYHFIPNSVFDKDRDNQIFAYVDTTFRNKVRLHIQPHVNITSYLVKFKADCENNEAFGGPHTFSLSVNDLPFEQNEFQEDAYYKFCLAPVHKNGTKYPTIHVASFCMQSGYEKLLKMMVGYGSIPVSIFFALYISYVLFKKKVRKWMKERRPSCMLVYSATHDAHIDVLIELAKYLNECGINAMIDVLDIPHEAHKNPIHWCDDAFQRANTIVVVASPRCKNTIVTKTIYRSLDNHAMTLIHENRRHQNKNYLSIQLPYCEKTDVPKGASRFTLLKIPKNLKILVNQIHRTTYTEVSKIPDERKLTECIESAKESILYGTSISKPKSLEKLTDLIISRTNETFQDLDGKDESIEDNTAFIAHESRPNRIEYATNIMDLDLLQDGKA